MTAHPYLVHIRINPLPVAGSLKEPGDRFEQRTSLTLFELQKEITMVLAFRIYGYFLKQNPTPSILPVI